jgi:hypothetical protein
VHDRFAGSLFSVTAPVVFFKENEPDGQMRLAGTPPQRVHLVHIPGSLFHDDAVHVAMRDIRQRIVLHQCGILCDNFQPVLFRKLNRSEDISHGVGIGVVELDILKSLLPAALELLDQVAAPSRAARIDLPFAVLLCRIRGGQIGPISGALCFALL